LPAGDRRNAFSQIGFSALLDNGSSGFTGGNI
jgi:hypothetical protein